MAKDGMSMMQFLIEGRYVAVVVDGLKRVYSPRTFENCWKPKPFDFSVT